MKPIVVKLALILVSAIAIVLAWLYFRARDRIRFMVEREKLRRSAARKD